MKYSEPTELNIDRTLETPDFSGAEGASVKYVKLSGKRTKNNCKMLCFFDGRVYVPSIFYLLEAL